MASQITNQATLNYNSGTDEFSAVSNTAVITLKGPLAVSKYSLENEYRIGEEITYNVFITNTSSSLATDIVVKDNLGTYKFNETSYVTPLTYINPAKVFINGVLSSTINGTVSVSGDLVTFNIGSLPSGSTLLLQYESLVNEYAGATVGTSQIENNVSVTSAGISTPIVAKNTIPVEDYAKLQISKDMSPDPVVDGSTIIYTFVIKNYGNIPATSVTLDDTFKPAPIITSVTVDGVLTTDYDDNAGVFEYPATLNAYTIPAATFTQNTTTGVISITPGTSTIVVTGTI